MLIGNTEPDHVPAPIQIPKGNYRLQTSRIAGLEHHHINLLTAPLEIGSELTLLAEPANPHDKYAVRIQHKDALLGYLPRTSNHVVSRLLRQTCPLTAQVAYLSRSPGDHHAHLDSITHLSIHILLKK